MIIRVMLGNFFFVVRDKSKKLVDLMKNKNLLKEEREKAEEIRMRLGKNVDVSVRNGAKVNSSCAPSSHEEAPYQYRIQVEETFTVWWTMDEYGL